MTENTMRTFWEKMADKRRRVLDTTICNYFTLSGDEEWRLTETLERLRLICSD